eukprot:6475294-Alexandrium_andersonii.AAC.1
MDAYWSEWCRALERVFCAASAECKGQAPADSGRGSQATQAAYPPCVRLRGKGRVRFVQTDTLAGN